MRGAVAAADAGGRVDPHRPVSSPECKNMFGAQGLNYDSQASRFRPSFEATSLH